MIRTGWDPRLPASSSLAKERHGGNSQSHRHMDDTAVGTDVEPAPLQNGRQLRNGEIRGHATDRCGSELPLEGVESGLLAGTGACGDGDGQARIVRKKSPGEVDEMIDWPFL